MELLGLFIGGFIIQKISVLPSGKGWNFHQWLYLGLTSLIGAFAGFKHYSEKQLG